MDKFYKTVLKLNKFQVSFQFFNFVRNYHHFYFCLFDSVQMFLLEMPFFILPKS